ncbi:MAG: tryptophan-rich sensory protein [Clostridiales bacterium]|nr:tryptophan-rich sensory protein [Clostridiales bacterium]
MRKFNWKLFIVCLFIPLAVGALSTLLVYNNLDIYSEINLPAFAPPSILFGIVWTILYVLMGISLYLVLNSGKSNKDSIWYFATQLFFNFCWPIAFFNLKLFWFAFVWLLILLYLIIRMILNFWQVRRVAGILQIPYAVWVAFAGVLNLAIAILN